VVAERSHPAGKRSGSQKQASPAFLEAQSRIHLLRRIQDRATFPSFKKPNEGPSKSKAEMAAQ
jgi:hypothetical protein